MCSSLGGQALCKGLGNLQSAVSCVCCDYEGRDMKAEI